MSPEEIVSWATGLIAAKRVVYHLPTGVVGTPVRFYDGVLQKWTSPVNGEAVNAPVIELDSKHAPLAKPESFAVLGPKEARFLSSMQAGLAALVEACVRTAQTDGMSQDVAFALLVAAFRAQLAALEAEGK